jgi:acetyl-CoA synthetase
MTYHIKTQEEYQKAYEQSIQDPEGFWAAIAMNFHWQQPWNKVLEWDFQKPDIKWFVNGKLNITANCLDRHLEERGDKTAIIWEPNDEKEQSRHISYKELYEQVSRFANVLKAKGIRKGDRVCIYLPMIPELAVATLACARIGAVHSIVFAGFSSKAIADRINDASCKMVITSDGMYRADKQLVLKDTVDKALNDCKSVEQVLVVRRTGDMINMQDGRDVWLHHELEKVQDSCPPEIMDSEDMLFILYTSGSTGKPKGVVHTIGGFMVTTGYTFLNVFQYEEEDVYWCTADVGWITGHSYIVYGPLLNGATTVMFEGVPTYPDNGRFWKVIDKLQVNQFYTAPTAIRSLMAEGAGEVEKYRLDSLKVIGTVGEPINEEAWHWYNDKVGKRRCPLVDTWWQTETGGIMISSLPNITPQKPGFAATPLPGVQPVLVDAEGKEIEGNEVEGYLCMKFPWPGMLRTTYGDHERCRLTYFSAYPDKYFTGDGAKRDKDGLYRILGRVDDVINVSGHRFGTAEIESAIDEHPIVSESAVVGYPHQIKGQGIYAYVILNHKVEDHDKLRAEINELVTKMIGKIARPEKIQIVPGLPKTRSGKIMRRILRKIAAGDAANLGDITTLLDPDVVEKIKEGALIKA